MVPAARERRTKTNAQPTSCRNRIRIERVPKSERKPESASIQANAARIFFESDTQPKIPP